MIETVTLQHSVAICGFDSYTAMEGFELKIEVDGHYIVKSYHRASLVLQI
jgi:C1A family cysteine protease